MEKELHVKCPHCAKVFSYYASPFRPFCCERCRMVDLGNWLSGKYAVPVEELDDKDDKEEEKDLEGVETEDIT